MGNSNSLDIEELNALYDKVDQVNDTSYGEITLLEDKESKERLCLRELLCNSAKTYEKQVNFLKTRKGLSNPSLLNLANYSSKTEENLCTSSFKVYCVLDYFANTLDRQIAYKIRNKQRFNENDLWHLISDLTRGLGFLQKHAIIHGDVRPETIFYNEEDKHYKVCEHNLLGSGKPAYRVRLNGDDDQRAYLSPSLMSSLSKAELKPNHDPWKSDVFSAALTIVHAATLTPCDSIYNWRSLTIEYEALERLLRQVNDSYSDEITKFIRDMLESDEEKRPDFLELAQKLKKTKGFDVVSDTATGVVSSTTHRVDRVELTKAAPPTTISGGGNESGSNVKKKIKFLNVFE